VGACSDYHVDIHGDGIVEYEGNGPAYPSGRRRRQIDRDEVVSLVNDFLRARFFEAQSEYGLTSFVVRDGDVLRLRGRGGADEPREVLTLRLGGRTKTVTLRRFPEAILPTELTHLVDRIDAIGGPGVW